MIWMDVDTALASVPVNAVHLIDDTDFKTREDGLTYDQAGLDLKWVFTTTAGVTTSTSVTPTTGGTYDWTNLGNGYYAIEIPASGGVSINNDTEGFGHFEGYATGVLPWVGPTIGFRRAALNDLLIDGSTASTNLEDFFDGTGYAGGTAKLTVDLNKIFGTALSESGAGYLAAAFKKLFDVATPDPTMNDLAKVGEQMDLVNAPNATAVTAIQSGLATLTKLLKYVQLLARSDAAITTDNATELTAINADGGSGAGDYAATSDSQEAIRDNMGTAQTGDAYAYLGTNLGVAGANATEAGGTGDQFTGLPAVTLANGAHGGAAATITLQTPIAASGNWSTHSAADVVTALGTGGTLTACLTATGFSTHSAADVVTALGTGSTLTACLTATGFSTHSAADVVTALGTGSTLTAIPWNAAWDAEAQSECADALTAWGKTGFSLAAGGMDSVVLPAGIITATSIAASALNGKGDWLLSSVNGSTFTAIPWNAAWDAEAQSECADAITAAGLTPGGDATAANQTTLLNRIGAFTGTGVNTILGFLKALLSKTATTPSDVGGTFDPTTDSTEAIRDRGDAAWASSLAGTGEFAINHDSGGTNAMAALTAGAAGIAGVTVRAYLTSDYNAGNQSSDYVRGTATTNDSGGWINSMMLNAGTYTVRFEDPTGGYEPTTKSLTIASDGTASVT